MFVLADGDRYEGSWKNGMKDGPGKFLYLTKGQVYTGYWKEDIAKTGALEDYQRDQAPEPPVYPIPKVRMARSGKHLLDCFLHCLYSAR